MILHTQRFIRFTAAALAMVVAVPPAHGQSAGDGAGEPAEPVDPPYVDAPVYPTGRTSVFGVARGHHTDLVLLEAGYDQGFRTGALCDVSREDQPVGEIILIEVREDRAAALITELQTDQAIRSGDTVSIQTIRLR